MTNYRRDQVWIKTDKLIDISVVSGRLVYPLLQRQVGETIPLRVSPMLWEGVGGQLRSIWLLMPQALSR